jgi:hypothetical protein
VINVTMLVFNSVYKDSRVLKEAESLSKNDCAVTIVGLDDGQETPTLELPQLHAKQDGWRN